MFHEILKRVVMKAEAARSFQADPLQSFTYKISIPGLPTGVGFQKVSGISREVEVIEYFENMSNKSKKMPGRETVGDITFERGAYADKYLQSQYEAIFKSSATRKTVVIQVCDRQGNVRREFKCAEAWFSKYECGDLDASSSEVLIETLTMTFEYFL